MSRTPLAHNLPREVQALHLALTTAAELHRPPCRSRDEWTSESADDRASAIEACQHCPIQAPCAAYALAADERHGVWAGVDRGDANARRRAQRRAASA